jgi:hypothetical protein
MPHRTAGCNGDLEPLKEDRFFWLSLHSVILLFLEMRLKKRFLNRPRTLRIIEGLDTPI